MKGRIAFTLIVSFLCGCAAGPQPATKIGYYDLGPIAAAPNNSVVAALRGIDVYAPSWLDSSALQYRLAYLGTQQRQNYAESRWVAAPAELLGYALRKRMLAGETAGACKLRVDLDEFVHIFDAPDRSRGLIEARVQLLAPGGGALLARRAFNFSRVAATADAKGGVAALSGAVEDFAQALHDWLGGLDRGAAKELNIARRCRGS